MLKHKDDLRRRLTIAEVPEPPTDLVQKIKHDIPKHFTSMTAKEVERKPREAWPLWNFWGMSWQLAAAILVLIGLTWAVFEAYQSELGETARIAEANRSVTSVEEFEKRVTDDSDVIRVEGTSAVGRIEASGDDGVSTPSAPAVPTEAEAARERELDERQAVASRRDAQAPARQAFADETVAQPRAAEPAAEAPEAPMAAGARSNEAVALKSRAATPQPVTAAAPAAAFAEEAVAAKMQAGEREVRVEGLEMEQTVKVELTLDPASGRVVNLKLPEGSDRIVIEAVTAAARSWTFETKDSSDPLSVSRTIDVVLKRK